MKAARPYPIVTITPKGERAIVDGHPWVYEGEVVSVSGTPEDGGLVDVVSKKGSWLGCGFYNSASKIRVRLVTRNANDDPAGDAFWERRLRYAWDYRKTVMGEADSRCCRIIFGEADGFPGLTVDRFERVLVAQVLSLGMERIKERVLPLLVRILREDGQVIRGVYERNDAALRTLEGMAQGKGWLVLPGEAAPEGTAEDITENGIRYTVDFENGQKTGFFLDQKYNRLAVAKLAKGKTVLDCFTHTGSFALNAAKGGAKRVTAVDVSQFAVDCAAEIRLHHSGPAGLHQEPQDHTQRHDRVQGDQLPGHEAAAPGRISGHVLVQPLRVGGAVHQDAAGRRPGRGGAAAADRSTAAVRRPPHPVGRGGDELSEILYFSGGVTGFLLPSRQTCGILFFTVCI